jgi:membrane protease subunit (stomatin/prohibitin family)
MLFFKKKVSFSGEANQLISKHSANSYDKNQKVEVPRGYEVILMEANGQSEVLRNVLEFKLKDKTKYIYYVKGTKNILKGNWGTPSRIDVKTVEGKISTLGGYGTFEFKLANPLKFINTRMNNSEFAEETTLTELVLSKIIELFQLASTQLPSIDESKMTEVTLKYKSRVQDLLKKKLDENGIEIVDFVIENLNVQAK